MSDLRKRATSGIAWSAVERFSQLFVVFVVQVILARLLEPSQFGLIAMVAVFVLISNSIVEAGMGAAIIQRQDLQNEDISTIFFFNMALAVVAAAGLWALGPMVARFYDQPVLAEVLPVLGVGLLFSAAGVVQRSQLQKQLAFRRLFWVTTPANVVSGAVGIVMAWQGFGVWALVGQNLVQKLVSTLCLWWASDWRPGWTFHMNRLQSLLPYSSRLAASSVLDQAFSNIYVLVIGKIYAPAAVGFYQRAKELRTLPLTTLQSVVSSVTFPIFAELQHDTERLREALQRSLQLSVFVAGVCMACLAGLAEPIILVLLGEKWLPSAPLIQILCLSGVFYPLQAGNLNLLKSLGRSDLFLRLEVIKKVLTVANILVTYRFGLRAMLIGMVVVSLLSLIVNAHYSKKLIGYGLRRQFQDLYRSFGFIAAVLLISHLVAVEMPTGAGPKLIAGLTLIGIGLLFSKRLLHQIVQDELGYLIKKLNPI